MAKCIGCGITLQSLNQDQPGYVPSTILVEEGNIYCKRCFNIIHYGKLYDPTITNKEYYEKIDRIKDENAIVLLMIDCMDIYGGFIPNLYKHIGNNPVIILVNKIDLFPKDISLKLLEAKIKELAKENNLALDSVIMISSKKKKNIERIINKIDFIQERFDYKNRNVHHNPNKALTKIYVIGVASTGKSTFLNIFKKDIMKDDLLITTSLQMQTTLDFIKITIDKYHTLIDTPGFINYHSYQAYLNSHDNEILNAKNYLKPKTYQLNGDQTIYLGGLVRLDFYSEEKINVSFYTSNELYIHRTKRTNADKLYIDKLGTLLVPPTKEELIEELKNPKNLKKVEYNLIEGSYDIFISGIGFIHIKAKNCKAIINLYHKIDVNLTESII